MVNTLRDVILTPQKNRVTQSLRKLFASSQSFCLQVFDEDKLIGSLGKARRPSFEAQFASEFLGGPPVNDDDDNDEDDELLRTYGGENTIERELQIARHAVTPTLVNVAKRPTTPKWTVSDARELGFSIEKATEMRDLFPSSSHVHLPDKMPPSLERLHNLLPQIEKLEVNERPAAFLQKLDDDKLGQHYHLWRDLGDNLQKKALEPSVDALLGALLREVVPKGFVVRTKPHFAFSVAKSIYGGTKSHFTIVSVPDYGVTSSDGNFVTLASEAKGPYCPRLGQLAGEALAFSAANLGNDLCHPLPVFQMRGSHLTFGIGYCSREFITGLFFAEAAAGPAALQIFTPTNSNNFRHDRGYDLLDYEERELAFNMMAKVVALATLPQERLTSLPFPVVALAEKEHAHRK